MTLPAALTLIPVHGRILKADASGTPATGTVSFRVEQTLRDTTDNVLLTPTTLTATLDATGSFAISLPATDDLDVVPQGWTYAVTVATDALRDSWRISVPAATVGTLEFADIAPAVSAPALVTYALASALTSETARATAAEQVNTAAITAETIRATAAEQANATAIAAETSRATAAEQTNATAITAKVNASEIPDRSALYPGAARLPKWAQPSSVITTFQTGHGWTSSGTGATFNLNDTTAGNFISGSQAATVTTAGTAAQANIRKFAGTVPDTTGMVFRLRLRVDDVTHLNELDFYCGSSLLANAYKWSFFIGGGSAWITSGDWATVTLSFADATLLGTPARSGMTDLQLQAWDDAAGTATVHLQSVELIPDGSTVFPNGVASICFDDSWSSPRDLAWAKLDGLGYRASLFTITDLIGTNLHLTLADLKTRVDRFGWESAAHAYTDADHTATYTGLSAAALDADLRGQRAWLIANGVRVGDGTAYPLGQFGKTSDASSTTDVVRRYCSWARTTSNRTRETFPPADPYRIRAISSISTFAGGTTPTSLTTTTTGTIDKAKANSAWLVLVFHKIVSGTAGSTTECAASDFNAIVDKLTSAGMPVLPIGDVLRYYG